MAKKKTADATAASAEIKETADSTEENTTAETAAAESTTATSELKVKKYVYVGATVGNIRTNTVIEGNIPSTLDKPYLRELCIPIDELAEFKRRLGVTSSREAHLYRKSAEYAKTR